jgi:hypothetical protein
MHIRFKPDLWACWVLVNWHFEESGITKPLQYFAAAVTARQTPRFANAKMHVSTFTE